MAWVFPQPAGATIRPRRAARRSGSWTIAGTPVEYGHEGVSEAAFVGGQHGADEVASRVLHG